jgi:uncharacterized membrane protein YcaP (DUF421 family)
MTGIVLRTLFFYTIVLFMMRLMGKREIGNLSPFDLVVSIMIAELAALPIEDLEKPLLEGVLPLLTLLVAEIALSYCSLKFEKVRSIVNGTPSIVIARGVIMEEEMRKMRYNINDLLVGLRSSGIVDVADVEYAVLEPSGTLSVIPVANKRPLTATDMGVSVTYEGLPLPIITDGRVHWDNLKGAGIDEDHFHTILKQRGVERPREVLFAYISSTGQFEFQRKRST